MKREVVGRWARPRGPFCSSVHILSQVTDTGMHTPMSWCPDNACHLGPAPALCFSHVGAAPLHLSPSRCSHLSAGSLPSADLWLCSFPLLLLPQMDLCCVPLLDQPPPLQMIQAVLRAVPPHMVWWGWEGRWLNCLPGWFHTVFLNSDLFRSLTTFG